MEKDAHLLDEDGSTLYVMGFENKIVLSLTQKGNGREACGNTV